MHCFYDQEPIISVGLMEEADAVTVELNKAYVSGSIRITPGIYTAKALPDGVCLFDESRYPVLQSVEAEMAPVMPEGALAAIHNVTIGKRFHWQRLQKQTFEGTVLIKRGGNGLLTVVNRLGLERYLTSVICSEMSAESPFEFLKAHCVISRSWTLAQLDKKNSADDHPSGGAVWTDARAHREYDLCADDHCQRYHGTSAVNRSVKEALEATRGEVLISRGRVCDTRFSKCCGGITERFSTAWQDVDVDYLQSVSDAETSGEMIRDEQSAEKFILSTPDVFCNVSDRGLLQKILPGFDFETRDFFRWELRLPQNELTERLLKKTGIDFGRIKRIVPLARGPSGRIYRLRIHGEAADKVFGKELEIRRILSETHLYSSAFVVEPAGGEGIGKGFILKGAGWGHGVGLCQIGAAAMAFKGYSYRDILCHYFKNASIEKIY